MCGHAGRTFKFEEAAVSRKREVPFFNYPALYAGKRDQYLTALDDALGRGAYIMQKDLRRFEKNLASYLGVRHVLGTADGTMALLMGLLAIGIEPGDEVIVPTHTFVASASAVHHAGGVPVLVDCGEDHLMDVAAVRSAVSSRTRSGFEASNFILLSLLSHEIDGRLSPPVIR